MDQLGEGQKLRQKWGYFWMGALLGAASFLIVYGVTPLDVTNDSWIFLWYDETDIVERYSAWVNLRRADWVFPLSYTGNIAYPDGTIISFMDGMPWICLLFKLFSAYLPETFQFEGVYLLFAFAVQGGAAALILGRSKLGWLGTAWGTLLFTFSPILLERGFRHTSLASHYLILLAMLLWLGFRDKLRVGRANLFKRLIPFFLLTFFSVGITPYFVPMVLCFAFLSAADYCRYAVKWTKYPKALAFLAANCCAVVISGCLLGTLGSGVSSSRAGYGEFSLNLNALYNPHSLGGYTWSQVLPVQPQQHFQYDGFNYLGLGMLILLVLFLSSVLIRAKGEYRNYAALLKENLWVILACLCMTLFAVSNVVTFNDWKGVVPLPAEILELCGIFRASGRIFWPVYYLTMVGLLYWCAARWKELATGALMILCCIQIVDMGGVIQEKHTYFQTCGQELQMEFLDDVAGYDELVAVSDYPVIMARAWGAFCGKNGLQTNMVSANSGEYPQAQEYKEQTAYELEHGLCRAGRIYYTENIGHCQRWQEIYVEMGGESGFRFYEREWRGMIYYLILPPDHDVYVDIPWQVKKTRPPVEYRI